MQTQLGTPSADVPPQLQAMAPLAVGIIVLFLILRAYVPARLFGALGRVLVAVVLLVVVVSGSVALAASAPGPAVALWLLFGLPAFLLVKHVRGAAARETRERQLARAREGERRRAPPPLLPPPPNPGGAP